LELLDMERWRIWHASGRYNLLPYVQKTVLEGALLPPLWTRFWRDASAYACILESGKAGRYTIAGLMPDEVIFGKGPKCRKAVRDGSEWSIQSIGEGKPLEQVRSWMLANKAPKLDIGLDMHGGAIGYWSYDVVRSLEKIPEQAADDLALPDYLFMRFGHLWIADHDEKALYTLVHLPVEPGWTPDKLAEQFAEARRISDWMVRKWENWLAEAGSSDGLRLQEMRRRIDEDGLDLDVEKLPGLATSMSKESYQDAVCKVQEYIRQGDVFQVNLSLRQSLPAGAPAEELYEWLRLMNPSPYMGVLRTPDFALVSASPELLIQLKEGRMVTRPIAGTRRRGRTPGEDLTMEDELLTSEKERAEHIMLVDLLRNDLGRAAAYGSVKVPELMTIERYSHVMHLVSRVEGTLAPGKDAFDAVAAVFPGGTITGAPKVRTMEIIEELEPVRRGPYTGSMGWIDYAGNMELNIIIRTIVLKDGICHIQSGAGIVIDSEPRREFQECLNKSRALWKAWHYGHCRM
jgi:para-aminobenzoate synthetase component 1